MHCIFLASLENRTERIKREPTWLQDSDQDFQTTGDAFCNYVACAFKLCLICIHQKKIFEKVKNEMGNLECRSMKHRRKG